MTTSQLRTGAVLLRVISCISATSLSLCPCGHSGCFPSRLAAISGDALGALRGAAHMAARAGGRACHRHRHRSAVGQHRPERCTPGRAAATGGSAEPGTRLATDCCKHPIFRADVRPNPDVWAVSVLPRGRGAPGVSERWSAHGSTARGRSPCSAIRRAAMRRGCARRNVLQQKAINGIKPFLKSQ